MISAGKKHTLYLSSMEELSKADFKKNRFDEAIRKKKIKTITWTVVSLTVVGLLAVVIFGYGRWQTKNLPGVLYPDQGREHVALGTSFGYNSSPPTSGPHYATPEEWGVFKKEIDDQILIHNLEHGGVWISYKPGTSEDVIQKLESFYQKYGRKIIVVPRAKNDTDIALAAWNHLDKFNASDYTDERVEKFVKAFRNKGPEFVP